MKIRIKITNGCIRRAKGWFHPVLIALNRHFGFDDYNGLVFWIGHFNPKYLLNITRPWLIWNNESIELSNKVIQFIKDYKSKKKLEPTAFLINLNGDMIESIQEWQKYYRMPERGFEEYIPPEQTTTMKLSN